MHLRCSLLNSQERRKFKFQVFLIHNVHAHLYIIMHNVAVKGSSYGYLHLEVKVVPTTMSIGVPANTFLWFYIHIFLFLNVFPLVCC